MINNIDEPQWERLPCDKEKLFGMSRSSLYRLMKRGLIKHKHLRRDGAKKGMTYVDGNSIKALIDAAPDN